MNEISHPPVPEGSRPRHAAKHCRRRRRRIWIPILAVFLSLILPLGIVAAWGYTWIRTNVVYQKIPISTDREELGITREEEETPKEIVNIALFCRNEFM